MARETVLDGPWLDDFIVQLTALMGRYDPVVGRPSQAAMVKLAGAFAGRRRLGRGERRSPPEPILFFVTSGLLRIHFSAGDGKEWTKEFITAPGFGGPVAGRAATHGFHIGLHALEDTVLVEAPYLRLKVLAAGDADLGLLLVALLEFGLLRKAFREKTLIYQTAAERYAALRESDPDLVARVPQVHLASYLGVTDVALSRIKHRTIVS